MSDLIPLCKAVLVELGFEVHFLTIDGRSVAVFEDDVAVGFIAEFSDARAMLGNWRSVEDSVIRRYGSSLRDAGDKSWNVYSVFICGVGAMDEELRQVRWIEEDLARTRKIAACGIASRGDLERALLPLLPLRSITATAVSEVRERMKVRVREIAPRAHAVVFAPDVPPDEVVRLLGEDP